MLKYEKVFIFASRENSSSSNKSFNFLGESRKIQLKRKYSSSGNNGSVFTECFQLSVVPFLKVLLDEMKWKRKMTENSNHELVSHFTLIKFN